MKEIFDILKQSRTIRIQYDLMTLEIRAGNRNHSWLYVKSQTSNFEYDHTFVLNFANSETNLVEKDTVCLDEPSISKIRLCRTKKINEDKDYI